MLLLCQLWGVWLRAADSRLGTRGRDSSLVFGRVEGGEICESGAASGRFAASHGSVGCLVRLGFRFRLIDCSPFPVRLSSQFVYISQSSLSMQFNPPV